MHYNTYVKFNFDLPNNILEKRKVADAAVCEHFIFIQFRFNSTRYIGWFHVLPMSKITII